MPELFYQVRKKVGDIRNTLPDGVRGPFFNDEFGDTFGNVYALHGEGFSYAELKRYADEIRRGMLRVPDVAKVDILGEQEEKILIELSTTKLAMLGGRHPAARVHPAGAERRDAGGLFRDADRPDLHARRRCVPRRRRRRRARSARAGPHVPAGRHRACLARLRRSTRAEVPLHGAGRARTRRVDEAGRRHRRARPASRRRS